MTVRECEVIRNALQSSLDMGRFTQDHLKKELDGLKPLFLDGTATEEDKKRASQYEKELRNADEEAEILYRAIQALQESKVVFSGM